MDVCNIIMQYKKTCFTFPIICLLVVLRSTRECFTHMESSSLPVKGCKIDLSSALMVIEQCVFFSVPYLLWVVIRLLYWLSPRTYVTLTCCREPGSGSITTYFNDLSMSWTGMEPWSPSCEATFDNRAKVTVVNGFGHHSLL